MAMPHPHETGGRGTITDHKLLKMVVIFQINSSLNFGGSGEGQEALNQIASSENIAKSSKA
jgi:hypothetical protein